MTANSMLILIAGPYRSGTDGDPHRRRGLPVYHDVAEIPRRTEQETV
ncbi:hypothetical protein ACIRTB_23875 [Streptomyces sp. NPDC101158]